MTHILGPPLTLEFFGPKEAESTVALGVDFTAIDHEALRDSGFHLGGSAAGLGIDISTDAMAAVHDKDAVVHAFLRRGDEVEVMSPTCPGGVDVRVWVENRSQILPFT